MQGQILSLQFNSVLPPQGLFSMGGARETIKEWLLEQLIQAFPAPGAVFSACTPGVDIGWAREQMLIERDVDQAQISSVTVLLPHGAWTSALFSHSVSIGGGFCTVCPINTHTEVSLSQADHQVFLRILLSLKLSPIASLWLLEDVLTRAFPGAFISCSLRFTVCRAKDTRARKKGY